MIVSGRTGWTLAMVALLPLAACAVDPVDFTGKSCSGPSDCPDGYQCEAGKWICLPSSGADGSLADAQVAAPDAQVPPDAEVVEAPDAAVEEPSDAQTPEPPDATVVGSRDAQVPEQPDATAVGPRDAQTSEPPDATTVASHDAQTLGPDATAEPPDAAVVPEDAGLPPDAAASGMDAAAAGLDAGFICTSNTQCGNGNYCGSDGACHLCSTDQYCGLACLTCGAGSYCSASSSTTSCVACNVAQHCGPSCAACLGSTPYCVAQQCVACRNDSDCAGQPGVDTCCNGTCTASQRPMLSSLYPLVVPLGTSPTIALYGQGFGACSQVLIDGQPVTTTYQSSTSLEITVPATLIAGVHPVAVSNPGPKGGASNPNSVSLGADLPLGGSGPNGSVGVAYVRDPDVVAVAFAANQTSTQLQLFDAIAWTAGQTFSGMVNQPQLIAGGTSTLVLGLQGRYLAVASPPAAPVQLASALVNNALSLDVDEAAEQVLVGTGNDAYQIANLTTLQLGPNVTFAGGPCCQAYGASIDGAYPPFFSYDHGAGFVLPSGFVQVSGAASGRLNAATDRLRHHALFALRNNAVVEEYDFTTVAPNPPPKVVASVVVPTAGWIAVNPAVSGNVVAMVPDAAQGALTLVDMAGAQVAGTLDAPRNRCCSGGGPGNGGEGDMVAVDPDRNRAFVTNSCSMMLEGYNLNVIFVK